MAALLYTLCTSGFDHNVMFSHNGPMVGSEHSKAAIVDDKHNSRDSDQKLLNDKDQQVLIVSCAQGVKSAIPNYLVSNINLLARPSGITCNFSSRVFSVSA